jgi:hypothetical protein
MSALRNVVMHALDLVIAPSISASSNHMLIETKLTHAVLASCALALDSQPLSPWGQRIVEATKLGPTVYPIIFAGLVGRLMKSMALWRAERGANLGVRVLICSKTLRSQPYFP